MTEREFPAVAAVSPQGAPQVLKLLGAALWVTGANGRQGHLLSPSPAALIEFQREGRDWLDSIFPSDVARFKNHLKRAAERQVAGQVVCDYRLVTEKSGVVWVRHWFDESCGSDGGRCTGVVQIIDEQKALEEKCISVCEREWTKIGHELHDDVCQLLTSQACLLQLLNGKLKDGTVEVKELVAEMVEQLNGGMTRTRALAHGLVPTRFEGMAIDEVIEDLKHASESALAVSMHCDVPEGLPVHPPQLLLHVYRIAQEAVRNAVRHGKARTIHLSLREVDDRMCLRIQDDGTGLPPEENRRQGLGLNIMNYRAAAIGGEFTIGRRAGGGTEVVVYYDTRT